MSSDIKNKLKSGVIIIALFSAFSLPLGYLRNWLLSKISVDAVSSFAMLSLVMGIVSTFFIFGAANVYSTFLPKISNSKNKSRFISSSFIVSILLMILMSVIFYFIYPYLPTQIKDKLIINNWNILIFFVISFGLGQVGNSALIGLRDYKLSAYLSNLQILIVTTFLTFVYFNLIGKFKGNELTILTLIIGVIWLAVFIASIFRFFSSLEFSLNWYLPRGYWNQAIFVHLGTILTFLYGYIDQILVLGYLGTTELAQYFITIQLASLVSFLPKKLGNVFQSSFSATLNSIDENSHTSLVNQYNKIAQYTLLLCFGISSVLILFGKEILILFGENLNLNILFLSLLVFKFFIGSLGSIHSMIILAKEKNAIFFFFNCLVVSIQLILSVLLVKPLGMLGIIISLIVSTIIGQFNLAYILKSKCDIAFYKPKFFMLMVFFLVIIIIIAVINMNIFIRASLIFLISIVILKVSRFDYKNLVKIIR